MSIGSSTPTFDLPPYTGTRYTALVPDTYDIHERASAVQNVLTRAVDSDLDHRLYFSSELARNPPMMWHAFWDICQTKFMQALPLIRLITGDESRIEVERAWLATALQQLGSDGLPYWPLAALPGRHHEAFDDPEGAQHCFTFLSYLMPLAAQYLRQPDPVWEQALRQQVDGLASVTIDRDTWAYIPMRLFSPDRPRPQSGPVPLGLQAIHLVGFALQGLGIYYRLSGYEPAGELAHKFALYLKDQAACFDADGRFLPNYPSEDAVLPFSIGVPEISHFHCHTAALLNMLEYAAPAGDGVLLEFIARSFEWARTQGEQTVRAPKDRVPEWTVGYFPENLYAPGHEESETCELADMIGLALKLSAAGVGDYWDDADRWIRNQFAENQLLDTAWLAEFAASFPPADPPGPGATVDQVLERSRGAFAGWAMANAWMNDEPHARTQLMHCCTGNGARAIYTIWQRILQHSAGRLRVNLLLNRASPWADVHSHLPYRGQVDLEIKQPVTLAVRIPGWATLGETHCTVNSEPRRATAAGRYLEIGDVVPDDRVTVTFPIGETAKLLEIEKRYYAVRLRGADVVHIEPPGVRGPYYQRAQYRSEATRWRHVERFVTDESVAW